MARRSPARFLAPVALVTCAVAAYAVVQAGTASDAPETTTARPASTTTTATPKTAKRRTYTVKSGDVLSAIAERTGVTLERLRALNPKVRADTLQPGQKLKLR